VVVPALRVSSGAAAVGVANISIYPPHIDPLALIANRHGTASVGVRAFVPARRAARMHPLVTPRHECRLVARNR
jgi:hypothetical protein